MLQPRDKKFMPWSRYVLLMTCGFLVVFMLIRPENTRKALWNNLKSIKDTHNGRWLLGDTLTK